MATLTTDRPLCSHCRRPFTPTRKRSKVCPRYRCKVQMANKRWNAWHPDRSGTLVNRP